VTNESLGRCCSLFMDGNCLSNNIIQEREGIWNFASFGFFFLQWMDWYQILLLSKEMHKLARTLDDS
jgi:hypothetical protein